jgi:hypothetical protein
MGRGVISNSMLWEASNFVVQAPSPRSQVGGDSGVAGAVAVTRGGVGAKIATDAMQMTLKMLRRMIMPFGDGSGDGSYGMPKR